MKLVDNPFTTVSNVTPTQITSIIEKTEEAKLQNIPTGVDADAEIIDLKEESELSQPLEIQP